MSKSAQRQFLVSIGALPAQYFATKTGGAPTATTTKVWDGGSLRPEVLASQPIAENITIGRPYDAVRDAPILTQLRTQVASLSTTLSITATDRNLVPISGTEEVYPDALLIRVTSPDVDAGSGDAARFELEFAVGDWT